MTLTLGALICTIAFFAGQLAARKLLRIEGVHRLSAAAEERYFQLPRIRRCAGRIAGPLVVYAGCVGLTLFSMRTRPEMVATLSVEVLPDGPAARAGMQTGDRIVAINGVAVTAWEQVPVMITAAASPVSIAVRRGAENLVLAVTPDEHHKILVKSRQEPRLVPFASALASALAFPIITTKDDIVGAWDRLTDDRTSTLMGPLAILRDIPKSESGSDRVLALLTLLLTVPVAHMWPLGIAFELLLGPRRPRVRRPA